ncbi:MAG: N-acetyltransferase family protein [Muribaculaceae bacterium]|nr:N-acetyltransferase family protein [Muribaculaceae bacterium]
MDNTIIRKGTVADAARVAEIYNHYVRTSPVIFSNTELTADEMAAKIERLRLGDPFPFSVAVDEASGQVAGYCYAHLWQPDAVYSRSWEITIYLAADTGGRGIGTALLGRMISECRELGAHTLVSFVTRGNTPCERLHTSAGFRLVGVVEQSGFKFGKYYDDAIYQLIL